MAFDTEDLKDLTDREGDFLMRIKALEIKLK